MIETAKQIDSVKFNKKTAKLPRYTHADEKYMGKEPLWESKPLATDVDEKSQVGNIFNWYSHYFGEKEAKQFLIDYLKSNKKNASLVKSVSSVPVGSFPNAVGWIARQLSRGAEDFPQVYVDKLISTIKELKVVGNKILKETVPVVKEKKKVKVPISSDKVFSHYVSELELEVDKFITNKCQSDFDIKSYVETNKIESSISERLSNHFVTTVKELKSINKQLVEGYSFLKKTQKKRYISFLEKIVKETKSWSENSKSKNQKIALRKPRMPRKPRKKDPIKMVKSIKFLKSFKELGLTSIDPVKFLGKQHLWMYNTVNKHLFHFVADDDSGLSVKGSTLLNFSEESLEKSVRKPKDVIPKILQGGKVETKRILTKLTTKEIVPTGRINKHCILLRTY